MCVVCVCVCAVKKKGGGKKGGGAEHDRPIDISRLDLRVGVVLSADKVRDKPLMNICDDVIIMSYSNSTQTHL